MVLAGDHLQLPPTIKSLNSKSKSKSKDADSEGIIKGMTLEKTLFDRLLALHGPEIKASLFLLQPFWPPSLHSFGFTSMRCVFGSASTSTNYGKHIF